MRLKLPAAELQAGDLLLATTRTVEDVRPLSRGLAVEVTLRDPNGQLAYAVWPLMLVLTVEREDEGVGV